MTGEGIKSQARRKRAWLGVAGVGIGLAGVWAFAGCLAPFPSSQASDAASEAHVFEAGRDAGSDEGGDAREIKDSSMDQHHAAPECSIDQKTYPEGTTNPSNACQSCQPGMGATVWSNAADGTSCGTDGVCYQGICSSGCEIADIFYTNTTVNPANGCQACNPGMSTKAWSDVDDIACSGGTCCSGSCVDESTDLSNCGACGNVCNAAIASTNPTCNPQGLCQYTLASGLGYPQGIAVDATNVYWTDNVNMTVTKMPSAGGTATILATGQGSPYDIALDATNVYWLNSGSGSVVKLALAGGTDAGVTLASDQNDPFGITVDATNVYWTTYSGGTVMKVPISGATAPTMIASGQTSPAGVAVNATAIYWTTEDGVMGALLDGGSQGGVATGQDNPRGITLDAKNLYWTDNATPGSVTIQQIIGGMPTTIAQNQPYRIATDSTNIYWTNLDNAGSVMSVPIAGGTPTILASDQNQPWGIAVDATSVYWADANGGTIMKVQKP